MTESELTNILEDLVASGRRFSYDGPVSPGSGDTFQLEVLGLESSPENLNKTTVAYCSAINEIAEDRRNGEGS